MQPIKRLGSSGKIKVASILDHIFPLYIALTLLSIIFLAPVITYACKIITLASAGFMHVALAVLVGFGFCWLYQFLRNNQKADLFCSDKTFNITLGLVVVVVCLAQYFVVKGSWFKTGWDAGTITDVWHVNEHLSYYSRFSNQRLLAALFDKIARFGTMLGQQETYLSLIAATCLCATVSVVFASLAAKAANGYACGYATLFISSVFVALSPWILVPYTDMFSLPFACAIIWAFTCLRDTYLKWPVIMFCTMVGYQIKPTVLFVFVAVATIGLWQVHGEITCSLKRVLASLTAPEFYIRALLICISILLALGASAYIKGNKYDNVDIEQEHSMTHFLMLGLNPDTHGVWSSEDVALSESCTTRQERTLANLEVIKERLEQYGLIGLLQLFVQKNLTNYNDGTMAWGVEGEFYRETNGANEFITSFFGIDQAGTSNRDNDAFAPLYHLVWIFLLLGIALQLSAKEQTSLNRVLMLSLILLSGFLMIFEARARYLIVMLPFFVILGAHGWLEFARRTCKLF